MNSSEPTMSSIEQQLGFLQGIMQEVSADVKALPGKIDQVRDELHQHMSDDRRDFNKLKEELEQVKLFQNKQKWTIGILVTLFGMLTSIAAFADKLRGLF